MTRNTMHLSILALNANGLNAPIKRHRIASCVKKKKTETYFAYKRLIPVTKINRPHKQAGVLF
jgi:hypothetical protein